MEKFLGSKNEMCGSIWYRISREQEWKCPQFDIDTWVSPSLSFLLTAPENMRILIHQVSKLHRRAWTYMDDQSCSIIVKNKIEWDSEKLAQFDTFKCLIQTFNIWKIGKMGRLVEKMNDWIKYPQISDRADFMWIHSIFYFKKLLNGLDHLFRANCMPVNAILGPHGSVAVVVPTDCLAMSVTARLTYASTVPRITLCFLLHKVV